MNSAVSPVTQSLNQLIAKKMLCARFPRPGGTTGRSVTPRRWPAAPTPSSSIWKTRPPPAADFCLDLGLDEDRDVLAPYRAMLVLAAGCEAAFPFEGKMVDAPVLARARQLLEQHNCWP